MRRFGALVVFVAGTATVGLASARSVAGADTVAAYPASAPRDLTPREQAVQVLNRLAFGPRPGEVDQVMKMGVDKWIDEQLHPERIPDRATDKVLASYPALNRSPSDLMREYPPPQLVKAQLRGAMTRQDSMDLRRETQQNRMFAGEIMSAKIARAVTSERQLQEVMTDFWENHFSVFIGKGQQIRYFLPDYDRETIRPYAFGRFRDLLGAVARSPAMLFYLDNWQSVADSTRPTLAPDVAARRPLGRGRFAPRGRIPVRRPGSPQGGAGQLPPDIRQRIADGDTAGLGPMAQRLAQLQQRRPQGLNENYGRELLELHTLGVDGGYTQQDVIEVARALTGWTFAPPRSGRSGFLFRPQMHDAGEKVVLGHTLKAGRGIEDGEQVLDILASQPATARFIARKLCVRFISDSPPDAIVDRAAETFMRTNGDIREVMRTIVTSPEFFSRAAFHAKVKSPFEVTVSALRALGAQADTTPRTALVVAFLGEPIFGHQAPNGYPETGEEWMNTGAILNRINFGLAVAGGRLPGAPLRNWPLYDSLAGAPRAQQVNGVVDALLGGRVSPETRDILNSGNNPLMAAGSDTAAASPRDSRPDDMGGMPARARGARRGGAGGAGGALAGGGGGYAGLLGRGQGPGLGQVPALSGLAQVVGLALGSPEFQRR